MSSRTYLSIGDVLTLLREEFPDVTISKIRFLESQGLVNPERSPSGYRKFFEADVERLRWVLRQQREHFLPLKVIRDRLADGDLSEGGAAEPVAATAAAASPINGKAAARAHAVAGAGVSGRSRSGALGGTTTAPRAEGRSEGRSEEQSTQAGDEAMARILADASRRVARAPETAGHNAPLQAVPDPGAPHSAGHTDVLNVPREHDAAVVAATAAGAATEGLRADPDAPHAAGTTPKTHSAPTGSDVAGVAAGGAREQQVAPRTSSSAPEPGGPAAGQAAAGAHVTGETAAATAAPATAAPVVAAPGETAPGEAAPGEAAPGEAAPGETAPAAAGTAATPAPHAAGESANAGARVGATAAETGARGGSARGSGAQSAGTDTGRAAGGAAGRADGGRRGGHDKRTTGAASAGGAAGTGGSGSGAGARSAGPAGQRGEGAAGTHPASTTGMVTGASMTSEELCAASGLSEIELAGLQGFGLIEPVMVAGIPTFDEDALTVANLAAAFRKYGIEARHLRPYRNAVDREVGLIEQVIIPLLRQRNPESRQRAVDAAEELGALGQTMRATLLRTALRRHVGG